jgi:sugar/nucleoside kinase (ribokinase family)
VEPVATNRPGAEVSSAGKRTARTASADAGRLTAAVIGAVSWNMLVEVPHLPRDLTTLHATGVREGIGATGAGKALALAHLGVRTKAHALLGDDEPGRRARAVLEEAGVELRWWPDPNGTERHLNLMDPHGDRVSVFLSHQSPDPDLDAEAIATVAAGADLVFVSLTSYSRRVLPLLAAAGVSVWVDLHDWDGRPSDFHAPFLEFGDHVFVSDVRMPAADAVASALAPHKELVVVTHGSRGATAYLPDRRLVVPAYDAGPAVDSNGAGDAFSVGVGYGRARGWDWEQALRAGAVLGGGCVTSPMLADPRLSEAWLLARV